VLVESIKSLFELLARLVSIKYERRRRIFDEVLAPLYDKFLKVDVEYVEMFNSTLKKIPSQFIGNSWDIEGKIVDTDSIEFTRHIRSLKDDFLEKRAQREGFRDTLRAEASTILSAVGHEEERRFLLALLYYFLDEGYSQYSDNLLNSSSERIIKEGGNTALPTPSEHLAAEMRKSNNPNELRNLLIEAITNLNQSSVVVSRKFIELKLTIINETATGK
jgi:hypothetical protein